MRQALFYHPIVGGATCEPLQHLAQSQGFAILPMPEGDAYPGLSVIPLGDDFTEHAVLAYRQARTA